MTYLSLILKMVLCVSVFITAFLGVFRRTIDEQKRLTNHGKVCIICVFITFSIGIGNELLSLQKEEKSATDKRASDDRSMIVQVKLDRALDDGKKRGEEAQAYMLEAEAARKKLEAVQTKLEAVQTKLNDMDARITDPTVKRMLGEVKKLAGNDTALTSEKLITLQKTLADVHDDLGEVRMTSMEGRDSVRGARVELATIKLELDAIKADVLHVQTLVTPQPSKPRSDLDAGFLDSGTFFSDGDKLIDAGN